MNTGAFGEGFPYSNFHNLNMDWIIKIAKDFLDQYTHIQEIIANGEASLTALTESGLEQLNETAEHITDLLNQWYDTHSEDIANELADAISELSSEVTAKLAEFQAEATIKANATIATIPDDYTTLFNQAIKATKRFGYHDTPAAPYDDFNTFPVNEVIYLFGGKVTTHSPDPDGNVGYYVATIAGDSSGALKLQIAWTALTIAKEAGYPVRYYSRHYDGTGWTSWIEMEKGELLFRSTLKTNYGVDPVAPYNDANTLPKMTAVLCYGNKVAHCPDNTSAFSVWTINPLNHSINAINVQIAVNVVTLDMFMRSSTQGDTYGDWKQLNIEDIALTSALTNQYGVTPVAPYDDADTFPKMSVVLAYGSSVANCPNSTSAFTIATLCALNHGITATTFQLASDVSKNKLYYRTSRTGDDWEKWIDLTYEEAIYVEPSDNLVNAIRQAMQYGATKIIINGGSHDVLQEQGIYSATTQLPQDFDLKGVAIGNGLVLEGVNGAKIIANYWGTIEDIKAQFSPLYITGDCTIRNIEFVVRNVRYCVHDDAGGSNNPFINVIYENCTMTHEGTNSATYTAPACIGGGTHRSSTHIIRECVFSSPQTYPYPVTYHNNDEDAHTYGDAHVYMTNCALLDGGEFQLYNYKPTGNGITCLLCGNYWGGQIHYIGDSSIFTVTEFNNTIYT